MDEINAGFVYRVAQRAAFDVLRREFGREGQKEGMRAALPWHLPKSGDEGAPLEELIGDHTATRPDEAIQRDMDLKAFTKHIRHDLYKILPPIELEVIVRHFYGGERMKDNSASQHCCQSNATQHKKRAIARLRKHYKLERNLI